MEVFWKKTTKRYAKVCIRATLHESVRKIEWGIETMLKIYFKQHQCHNETTLNVKFQELSDVWCWNHQAF